jgi:hypothetical protein
MKEKVSARDVAPSLHKPLPPRPHPPRAIRELVARPRVTALRPKPPLRRMQRAGAARAPKSKVLSLIPSNGHVW